MLFLMRTGLSHGHCLTARRALSRSYRQFRPCQMTNREGSAAEDLRHWAAWWAREAKGPMSGSSLS